MPEKTLALPLSGEEVRAAILKKIGEALVRDCRLSPNMAYDSFKYRVSVSLELHDTGRVEKVESTVGDSTKETDVVLEGEPEPPNKVRVDTGQSVPVLTQNSEGKSDIKRIIYKKEK